MKPGLVAGALVWLAPAVALACPVCAQRTDGGWARYVALGAIVLMPWAIAASVGLYIRKLQQRSAPRMEVAE